MIHTPMIPDTRALHRAGLRLVLFLLAVLAAGSAANAQQVTVDPGTIERLRHHGLIRDIAFEQRYPEPATPWAVRRLQLEGEPDPTMARYLERFLPPIPDPGASALDLVGALRALTDTLTAYGWVAPAAFADELRAHVDLAESRILAGPSSMAYGALFAFREAMYTAYAEPQPGVREVSREAERFLNSAVTDVIDRLE